MRFAGYALLASILVFCTMVLALPARSASFDCAKATHPLEKAICATPALSMLDSEIAAKYRARLASMFDRAAFRAQQRLWQQSLRAKCAQGCAAADVAAAYRAQGANIDRIEAETYEASYKTPDVATLQITHIAPAQFDFSIRRELDGKTLCALPASDGEAGSIARSTTPDRASWQAGNCAIDFRLTRDGSGHVSRIDVAATPGCRRYCATATYGLADAYLPANDWTPGNP